MIKIQILSSKDWSDLQDRDAPLPVFISDYTEFFFKLSHAHVLIVISYVF